MKTHFTTTEDVIEERQLLFDFDVFKDNGTCSTSSLEGQHSILALSRYIGVSSWGTSYTFMVSALAICEHFNLNCSGLLGISQSISVSKDGGVVETICWTCFSALTLVDWNGFSSAITGFAYGKEKWVGSLGICRYIKFAWDLAPAIFLFFSCNLDSPTELFPWILQCGFKGLIFAGDNLMQGKWIWPDEILLCEIIEVSSIISIINFHNEFLVFFEGEMGFNGSNPLWIEVIIDDFGESKSYFLSILDLK